MSRLSNATEALFVFKAQGCWRSTVALETQGLLLEGHAGFMSRTWARVVFVFPPTFPFLFFFFCVLEAKVEILEWNACSLCHYGIAELPPRGVRQFLSGSLVLSTFISFGKAYSPLASVIW